MKRHLQPLLFIALLVGACNADAEETAFPVPEFAYDVRHALPDSRTKQDYFKIRPPYSSVEVIAHYRALFPGWWECANKKGWESFTDHVNGQRRYVDQSVYYWIPQSNDKMVTLLFRYSNVMGLGDAFTKTPKLVVKKAFVLFTEPIKNAKSAVETSSVVCVPNEAASSDVQKQPGG